MDLHEAQLYERLDAAVVHCFLCAHSCIIKEGQRGICAVRQNVSGKLFSLCYGHPVAMQVDPIEKKPLYHFLPGSKSFSLATRGCNMRCGFCQNWQISQVHQGDVGGEATVVSPQEVVAQALANGCQSISYTYTEPTVFFEYAYAIAQEARAAGLRNVFVSNGYMSEQCRMLLSPVLDAANIDLKCFIDEVYRRVCGASLQPVLDSIADLQRSGVWVEVTTLIVPGVNDDDAQLQGIARFLAAIDPDIPWHLSRFHPDYQFDAVVPTPIEMVEKAVAIGRRSGLRFVYAGNVAGSANDTSCSACKKIVIKRRQFDILSYNVVAGGRCAFCQEIIPGIFSNVCHCEEGFSPTKQSL